MASRACDSNEDGRFNIESGAFIVPVDVSETPHAIRGLSVGCEIAVSGVCVMDIDNWSPNAILRRLAERRGRDVLKSMTLGLTNKEIANQLGIRKDGVEDHINVIFQKLGASNRAEAVAIAMRKQLLKM